jgi:hypothetical protein
MFDHKQAFRAAISITALCLVLAAALALFSPNPPPPTISRLLDALIYISIAGAVAIFGLLGNRPTKDPTPPSPDIQQLPKE